MCCLLVNNINTDLNPNSAGVHLARYMLITHKVEFLIQKTTCYLNYIHLY